MGKRLHINEGGLPGPSKLQGPVSEPNSARCNGQLNGGSLHNRGTHSAEMCALLWKIMTWCHHYHIESQTHFRVSECDGQPSIQVEPSSVNRMVTASTGVQTDLSTVVHSSCRPICHSSEPQTYTLRVLDPNAWDMDALNINWTALTAYAYPPNGSNSQGDPKKSGNAIA